MKGRENKKPPVEVLWKSELGVRCELTVDIYGAMVGG